MPYCPMCGSLVGEEDKYCLRCGCSLKEEPRPPLQLEKARARVKAVIPPTPPPTPKKALWTRSAVIPILIAVISNIIAWWWWAPIFCPVAAVCGLYVVVTQKQNTGARVIGFVLAFFSSILSIWSWWAFAVLVGLPTTQPLSEAVSPGTLQLFLAGVASTSAGVAWFMRRRRRGRVKTLLTEIESTYARRDEAELYKLKNKVFKVFKEGKVDEGDYMILQERIDDHIKELQKQRRVPRCAECDRDLLPGDKFCPFCGASVAH